MPDVWLVNPPRKKGRSMARKRKTSARKPPKGFRSWSAYMKYVRSGGKKRRTATKRATPKKRTTTRSRSTGAKKVAARKTTRRRTTTRRRRRKTPQRRSIRFTPVKGRVYRRNPPLNKALKTLTEGVQNAAFAVVGKAASRSVSSMIPFGGSGAADIAKQAVVAVGLGMVADKFLPKRRAEFIVAGALMGPIESAIRAANIPVISGALGSYSLGSYVPRPLGAGLQPALGAIPANIVASPTSPAAGARGMGSYDHALF